MKGLRKRLHQDLYIWICVEERHHQADSGDRSMGEKWRANCMKKFLFKLKSSLVEDFHSDSFSSFC